MTPEQKLKLLELQLETIKVYLERGISGEVYDPSHIHTRKISNEERARYLEEALLLSERALEDINKKEKK